MKILAMAIGTRGDVEPFLAIGAMLKEKGHEVICAFPEQYRKFADETGIQFFSLGSEFIDLLESDVGKRAMGGSGPPIGKMIAGIDYSIKSAPIQYKMIDRQHEIIESEKPDKILFNTPVTYPLAWGIKNNKDVILVSAIPCVIHYVKDYAHVGLGGDYGATLKKRPIRVRQKNILRSFMYR